jgi:cell division protein FtsB
LPDWEVDTDRTIWEAACKYKQKEIKELEAENAKLNQEIEKFKAYLEAWGSNE